jgi:hypothetical protein
MKNRVYGLFVFLVVVFMAPQSSWALSCPTKPVSCGYKAMGWQHYTLVVPKGSFGHKPKKPYCKKRGSHGCGDKLGSYHKQRYVDHGGKASCMSKIVDAGRVDGCSVPSEVDNMYGHLFVGACEEHDINYHLSSKKMSDNNFLGNMRQICEHFYVGSQNNAQKASCYAAAKVFHKAVVEKGQGGYNADHAWAKKHGCE